MRSARIRDEGMTRPILKLGIRRPVELSVAPLTVVLAIEMVKTVLEFRGTKVLSDVLVM